MWREINCCTEKCQTLATTPTTRPHTMSLIAIAVICVALVALFIAVTVVSANTPKMGPGKPCANKSQCDGAELPNSNVECIGGLCTGEDGKFKAGGACTVVAGEQRTSLCPEGHYCGRVPSECLPVGTKSDGGPKSLCAADLPDESCGYEEGTEVKDADGKVISPGIKLKCDGFGYCQRPKNSTPEGGACRAVDECVNPDGKMCCSLKDVNNPAAGKTCQKKVDDNGVFWCPDDPLHAAGKTVATVVSSVVDPNPANTEGSACGAFKNCATGLMCCPPVGGGATTCQKPLNRPGDPRTPKQNFCPSDPAALVPWPLSVDVGGNCTDHNQCKGFLALGKPGTPICCAGKCTDKSVAGILGIGLKCP